MILFTPAKINLGLHVLRKRRDNYHDIESILYPIPWQDAIELVESKNSAFSIYGRNIEGKEEDNLCVKAFRLMQETYQLPNASVVLLKNIPSAAGLGGGSSDAVAVLKLCNQVFELGLSQDTLKSLAASLGADCPFFVEGEPVLIKGRGDDLQQINISLKGMHLLVAWPDIRVSTSQAYARVPLDDSRPPLGRILIEPLEAWKEQLRNDFESSVFSSWPEIENLKKVMLRSDAIFASMSGSGSAVYGLWHDEPDIEKLKTDLHVDDENVFYTILS